MEFVLSCIDENEEVAEEFVFKSATDIVDMIQVFGARNIDGTPVKTFLNSKAYAFNRLEVSIVNRTISANFYFITWEQYEHTIAELLRRQQEAINIPSRPQFTENDEFMGLPFKLDADTDKELN